MAFVTKTKNSNIRDNCFVKFDLSAWFVSKKKLMTRLKDFIKAGLLKTSLKSDYCFGHPSEILYSATHLLTATIAMTCALAKLSVMHHAN